MRIVDLLERSARLYADKTAVEVLGETPITYQELRGRARSTAALLHSMGARAGDRVALIANSGSIFFDVYLACSYLGAAAVPLSGRLTTPELSQVLSDADPALAIVDDQYAECVRAALPSGVGMLLSEQVLSWPTALELSEDDVAATAESTALIIYTSGTTGQPKGVCLSQGNLCFNAMSIALSQELTSDDIFLSTTPLHHTAAGTRVFTMLLDGQTHIVMPSFTAQGFLETIETRAVTTTILVPTQLYRVVRLLESADPDLRSLRLLVYGAAPTHGQLLEDLQRAFSCGLYQGYGLTEACVNLTALLPSDHRAAGEHPSRMASCGRPVPGVQIKVRGLDGSDLAIGEVGELLVRSDKVMLGYWRLAEATAEAFADGWLCTGDLGRVDADGYVYLAGRVSELLIRGGVNIYPKEIEVALQRHTAVIDAAVVGRPHAEWGEEAIAFVTLQEACSVEDLLSFARTQLAPYKVPAEIRVISEFELTTSGKIKKAPLRFDALDASSLPPSGAVDK